MPTYVTIVTATDTLPCGQFHLSHGALPSVCGRDRGPANRKLQYAIQNPLKICATDMPPLLFSLVSPSVFGLSVLLLLTPFQELLKQPLLFGNVSWCCLCGLPTRELRINSWPG